MIIISDKDIHFNYDNEYPSNMLEYTFNNFNLTIIFSYLNSPSLRQTVNMFFHTTKEDYDILRGYEWWEIYNLYTYINMSYSMEYLNHIEDKSGKIS